MDIARWKIFNRLKPRTKVRWTGQPPKGSATRRYATRRAYETRLRDALRDALEIPSPLDRWLDLKKTRKDWEIPPRKFTFVELGFSSV